MTTRTALEIAIELDAASCSSFAKLEAAEALRQQHDEIDRLKRERHHIYDLLARIHRDGGQYAAEHGVEKACDDAEAQVVTWIDTISGIDSLIEQARIAERAACAATAPDLLWALETIIDASPEPPEANCSCHICPPCRDCVDYEELREAYRYVRAAIAKAA